MGAVVVEDQVKVAVSAELAVELAQEVKEFLVPVPRQAGAEDFALQQVEGGKEGSGAVALVVIVIVAARPRFIGKPGWVRSSA